MFVFVLVCITLCPPQFCNHLEEAERAGSFVFTVLLISCYCKCSVAFPHDVVGWSGVYDCFIS